MKKMSMIALASSVALQMVAQELREAYADGIDAAWRAGRYEGARHTPDCPYPSGTPTHKRWFDGFGDGTEDMIALQRMGDGG